MARMARGWLEQPDWGHIVGASDLLVGCFLGCLSCGLLRWLLRWRLRLQEPTCQGGSGSCHPLKDAFKASLLALIRWSKPRFKTRINKLHLLMGKWKNVCFHLPPLWNLQDVKSYTAFERTKLIKEGRHIGLKWGCGRRLQSLAHPVASLHFRWNWVL